MPIGALYLHIPFCARKCAYCDFASEAVPRDDPRIAAYTRDIREQLAVLGESGLLESVHTAYLGGGTPTMLGPRMLGGLVADVRRWCPQIGELTCEANPDSLTDDTLAVLAEAGVTRFSIGVQSLDDQELRALERIHTAEQAGERVRAAVATGLDVSVDLMCAIPYQTDDSWRRTLLSAIDLGVGHVSVYPLSIEEGTPFGLRYADADAPWNDEDVQAERMEVAERVLSAAGYARYEVASYARTGKQCAHNIAYWTGVPYLGLGPGAASMLDREGYDRLCLAWRHLPAIDDAAARLRFVLPCLEVEELTAHEAWAEDLMLGMRLTRGIEAARVPTATARELEARGLVEACGNRLAPTHKGWLLGNELYGTLWDLAGE